MTVTLSSKIALLLALSMVGHTSATTIPSDLSLSANLQTSDHESLTTAHAELTKRQTNNPVVQNPPKTPTCTGSAYATYSFWISFGCPVFANPVDGCLCAQSANCGVFHSNECYKYGFCHYGGKVYRGSICNTIVPIDLGAFQTALRQRVTTITSGSGQCSGRRRRDTIAARSIDITPAAAPSTDFSVSTAADTPNTTTRTGTVHLQKRVVVNPFNGQIVRAVRIRILVEILSCTTRAIIRTQTVSGQYTFDFPDVTDNYAELLTDAVQWMMQAVPSFVQFNSATEIWRIRDIPQDGIQPILQ
ncbi:hypothetical protein HK102_001887 [Quaeritorhiza haematococci]|nr:hypothetical protein HK102_001887 [Quaeritorhiza haematococci]